MTITILIEFVKIAITLFGSDGDKHFTHIVVSALNAWFTLYLLLQCQPYGHSEMSIRKQQVAKTSFLTF